MSERSSSCDCVSSVLEVVDSYIKAINERNKFYEALSEKDFYEMQVLFKLRQSIIRKLQPGK